jgi:tRNA (guanine37-N1)-methyltransferase
MADYDLLGNIAIIKSEKEGGRIKTKKEKIAQARALLKIPSVKTVLEKSSNVKGRLRTIKAKHILGEKNFIADYKENGCRFKFNIETCYFSPRLSNERKDIAAKITKSDKVLVMFAGVGVYPIVIYKISRPVKIVGVEIGIECCRYFKENLRINKIPAGKIEAIQGDVKKKIDKKLGKFDVIVMPRPNLKESFFKQGLLASKKGTRIFYYGFCNVDEINDMAKNLIKEAKKLKSKIKIVEIKKAGDIAPYKFRYRIEIKVLK